MLPFSTMDQQNKSKRVFVTGASGFVGSAVVEALLAHGHSVTALINRGQLRAGVGKARVVNGDLFTPAKLDEGLSDADAVVHLVGIIAEQTSRGITFDRMHVEATKNVIEAARRVGVRRFVHMSALGARDGARSRYHQTKFAAEQALRQSGLDWTIFQPSLIHGPNGEFLRMEADWARGKRPPFLFMPYFGGGLLGLGRKKLIQPVYVNDVARAFVEALSKPTTIGQTYCMGGSDRLTWPQMHHVAAGAFTGRSKLAAPLPAWYAKALTHIVPGKLLPFNRDQVIMAEEDSVCDMGQFATEFGWTPSGFEMTLKEYAASV